MSERVYTDTEILRLISEIKRLPINWRKISSIETTGNAICQTVKVTGDEGNLFVLKLRQGTFNINNFSLTLGFQKEGTTTLFRVKRYDGKYKQHTNPIEKESFYNFHIHTATERYQKYGTGEEDKYAIETSNFSNYEDAIQYLIGDCNFVIDPDPQLNLFGDNNGNN